MLSYLDFKKAGRQTLILRLSHHVTVDGKEDFVSKIWMENSSASSYFPRFFLCQIGDNSWIFLKNLPVKNNLKLQPYFYLKTSGSHVMHRLKHHHIRRRKFSPNFGSFRSSLYKGHSVRTFFDDSASSWLKPPWKRIKISQKIQTLDCIQFSDQKNITT